MNESGREPIIRRILVALDASPHSLSALEAAAELAASFQAELLGLFVEDINLLRLAELPCAREVGLFSGTVRTLDTRLIERQLRARAGRAREALAASAERAQVRWSFQTTSGQIAAELVSAAMDADLVILGKAGWSRQRRLGSDARAILSQVRGPVLVLQQGVRLGLPMLVLHDGSGFAQRALAAAVRLVQERGGHLVILLLADDPDAAQSLREEIDDQLGMRGLEARYRWLAKADVVRLCQVVRAEGGGVLVLHRDTPLLGGEAFVALLNEVGCPVLVVR
jgi:nucleotide-binding universal stress UspA family protein